jgi:hypothetical protein
MHCLLKIAVVSLLLLGLPVLWVLSLSSESGHVRHSTRQPLPAEDAVVELPKEVEGRGQNKKEAKREAVRKAWKAVVDYLRSLDPPVEWTPSLAYVGHRLGEGTRRPEKDVKVLPDTTVQYWTWPLAITADDLDEMRYQDRKDRMGERMLFLGKILAGILVLLIVVAGYVRLDEWTKGYYTGWLRLAGGILVLFGVGLWWLR